MQIRNRRDALGGVNLLEILMQVVTMVNLIPIKEEDRKRHTAAGFNHGLVFAKGQFHPGKLIDAGLAFPASSLLKPNKKICAKVCRINILCHCVLLETDLYLHLLLRRSRSLSRCTDSSDRLLNNQCSHSPAVSQDMRREGSETVTVPLLPHSLAGDQW